MIAQNNARAGTVGSWVRSSPATIRAWRYSVRTSSPSPVTLAKAVATMGFVGASATTSRSTSGRSRSIAERPMAISDRTSEAGRSGETLSRAWR